MSLPASSQQRANKHLDQARRNYKLYQSFLQAGQDLDWALTFLYYTAIHMVEAYGATLGKPLFGIHPVRQGFVSLELPTALCAFTTLHSISTDAKYKLFYPTENYVRKTHADHFKAIQKALDAKGIKL